MDKWILFSGPSCPWCVQVKDLLDKRGIGFTEIHIDSREKFQIMNSYAPGIKSVPVVYHNGKVLNGYHEVAAYLRTIQ